MAKLKITTNVLGDKRVGMIVENPGFDSDATIQEAIDLGYVVGKKEVIKAQVEGVLKAMFKGVEADGNGRKIDEIISLQPYAVGSLEDPTDNVTKEKIGAKLVARMLKQTKLDANRFSFIIEGATGTLRVTVITTGEEEGIVAIGGKIQFNGYDIKMGEGDKILWSIPETGASGEVHETYIHSEKTRITIDDIFWSGDVADPANNGRDIVFTVKIGNKKVVKSATIRA